MPSLFLLNVKKDGNINIVQIRGKVSNIVHCLL